MTRRHHRYTRHSLVTRMRDDVYISRHPGLALAYVIPSLIFAFLSLAYNLLKAIAVLAFELIRVLFKLGQVVFLYIREAAVTSLRRKPPLA